MSQVQFARTLRPRLVLTQRNSYSGLRTGVKDPKYPFSACNTNHDAVELAFTFM